MNSERQFLCHRHEGDVRLATLYESSKLRLVGGELIALPLLLDIPWHSKLIFSSKTEPKHALVSIFEPVLPPGLPSSAKETQFAVVNLHLDAMGENAHRIGQLHALARELGRRGLARRLVACGDTNMFSPLGRADQLVDLQRATVFPAPGR
jgi:hypothetical protein